MIQSIKKCVLYLLYYTFFLLIEIHELQVHCTTLENIGREVAPQRFLFQSKPTSHTEVAPPWFLF